MGTEDQGETPCGSKGSSSHLGDPGSSLHIGIIEGRGGPGLVGFSGPEAVEGRHPGPVEAPESEPQGPGTGPWVLGGSGARIGASAWRTPGRGSGNSECELEGCGAPNSDVTGFTLGRWDRVCSPGPRGTGSPSALEARVSGRASGGPTQGGLRGTSLTPGSWFRPGARGRRGPGGGITGPRQSRIPSLGEP